MALICNSSGVGCGWTAACFAGVIDPPCFCGFTERKCTPPQMTMTSTIAAIASTAGCRQSGISPRCGAATTAVRGALGGRGRNLATSGEAGGMEDAPTGLLITVRAAVSTQGGAAPGTPGPASGGLGASTTVGGGESASGPETTGG